MNKIIINIRHIIIFVSITLILDNLLFAITDVSGLHLTVKNTYLSGLCFLKFTTLVSILLATLIYRKLFDAKRNFLMVSILAFTALRNLSILRETGTIIPITAIILEILFVMVALLLSCFFLSKVRLRHIAVSPKIDMVLSAASFVICTLYFLT
ncbi:MAG: hypothetical protein AB7F23_08085 [Phycisphaerae bacterium]